MKQFGQQASVTQQPTNTLPVMAAAATEGPVGEAPIATAASAQPTTLSTSPLLVTSFEDVKKATIQIEAQGTFIDPQFGAQVNVAGRGSGFLIDPSGLAITNNHVVAGAALLKVWVGGDTKTTYNARILGTSECSDLAVIQIIGSDFPYLTWYDGKPAVGDVVYAAGFPLGDPEYTLTKGIISKDNTSGETSWASVDGVIEHDATINPGNSGGPLVNESGQVVGVNYASSGSTDQYFAIGKQAADLAIDLLKNGTDYLSIGVNPHAVVADDKTYSGVWVSSVESGSIADKAGIKAGDLIVSIENVVLAYDGTLSSYCDILHTRDLKSTMALRIVRWSSAEIMEGQLNGRELQVVTP
jgi:serine protease Do